MCSSPTVPPTTRRSAYNTFGQDSQTAINFAGDTGNPSVGLTVTKNTSINDATFLVAINSVNADIEGNKITVNGSVPGGNGTGILDFGGNSDLRIIKNNMTSNSTTTKAISLTTYAGSASDGTTVSGNTVSGWNYGVYVGSTYDSALIASNHITKNGTYGIYVSSSHRRERAQQEQSDGRQRRIRRLHRSQHGLPHGRHGQHLAEERRSGRQLGTLRHLLIRSEAPGQSGHPP